MGFNRSKIDAEFEALLAEDTFGDQFDFGFADDVEGTEATGASEEVKEQMAKLEKLILPILYNLKKNPDKEYIIWPDRLKKVEAFETHLQKIYSN